MDFSLSKNMTRREQLAVLSAGAAVILFIVYQFMVTPYLERKETLERQFRQKTEDLAEMLALKAQYEATDRAPDLSRFNFKNRDKGFTLFSFLDRLSGETGIKDHVTKMIPSSSDAKTGGYKISQVELKLNAINLKQLTDYLYGIETSKNMMFVKRLSLDKSSKPEGFIDVVMLVEVYEP